MLCCVVLCCVVLCVLCCVSGVDYESRARDAKLLDASGVYINILKNEFDIAWSALGHIRCGGCTLTLILVRHCMERAGPHKVIRCGGCTLTLILTLILVRRCVDRTGPQKVWWV